MAYNQGFEHHDPLEMVAAPEGTVHPNYKDTNVANEIPPLSDADGNGNVLLSREIVGRQSLWIYRLHIYNIV
jgi:hypothetical protein